MITAGLGVCTLGMALLALSVDRGLVLTVLASAVVGVGRPDAARSLSSSQAETAQGSISGALSVARQLGSTPGTQLADVARDAFNTAAARGYLIVAAVGLIGAVWARWALRNAP